MRGLSDIQNIKVQFAQGTPDKYYKNYQASTLGDATQPTSLHQQLLVSFHSFTCAIHGTYFVFIIPFYFVRHAPMR